MLFDNVYQIILHIVNLILWGGIIYLIVLAYRFLNKKLSK